MEPQYLEENLCKQLCLDNLGMAEFYVIRHCDIKWYNFLAILDKFYSKLLSKFHSYHINVWQPIQKIPQHIFYWFKINLRKSIFAWSIGPNLKTDVAISTQILISGFFSMFSLFLSICIPHWVTTHETLPLHQESPFPQDLVDLPINIGLFSVCPQVKQGSYNATLM